MQNYIFVANKPMSYTHRLNNLSKFADNPSIKIDMGQHHPTIALVLSFLLLAGIIN